ncbi:hypothetical protein NMG60_11000581 [Bertholletia excelsa]
MDTNAYPTNHQPAVVQRLLPAVVPVLLIAIGYIDPGKWAAAVEGGSHFGSNLVLLMLAFNFAAILCQYLSARIAVATERDLSQICSKEYDKATCILLGVLTEASLIALDLTMILGTAQGINLITGVHLFTCVFMTAIDAVLFPLFATLLDSRKMKFLCISMASFILLLYILGVLFSQPEISISSSGVTKLSGESAFALMSLLGANIVPHNFYLHSSIVQQELRFPNISEELQFHDHFFAILCIFSGIFLVNFVLMNAAASMFYGTGLVWLSFQDALSLVDQVFKSSTVPVAFLLVLFVSSHVTAVTWNLGRQAILHDFFGMDIPGWLHHAIIRTIALVPALYCVWNSGAEGAYQLLIFTQVVVALLLPSSVIPLFRVASSRSVMGIFKVSQFVEFLALVTFFGMLGLKLIFLVEMIFGNSDWVSNLWNVGSSLSVSYIVLLITGLASLCLMLWLAATPLKSSTYRLDNNGDNSAVPELPAQRDISGFNETRSYRVEPIQMQEPTIAPIMALESQPNISSDANLPETLLDSDNSPYLTTIEENDSNITSPTTSVTHPEEIATAVETNVVPSFGSKGTIGDSVNIDASVRESIDMVEKTVRVEGDIQIHKEQEADNWEPEETVKGVSGTIPSSSDGPGSCRGLSGRSEDSGSGTGSLSRLGLGRAARRQFAAVLDEFWGHLFDFHGQATQEAKAKKLDMLLGVDSKVDLKPASPMKGDTTVKEFTGYFSSMGGQGSDSPMNVNLYDSARLRGLQGNLEASYGIQNGSSSTVPSRLQLLDAYVRNSGYNALDSGEKRYSSLRLPSSSEGNDYQPATVHGYQIASCVSRIANQRSSDYLNGQMEVITPKSPSLGTAGYRSSLLFASSRKPQNGLSSMAPPGFSKPGVSRNISMQSEIPKNAPSSTGPAENTHNTANAKKFHSLPDISGCSLLYRDAYTSDQTTRWSNPMGYGSSLYSNASLKVGGPLRYDDLSRSKPYQDPFTLQYVSSSETGSLWSTQPFEQFGVGDKMHKTVGEGVECKQNNQTFESISFMDLEPKLLQLFRHCIMKLLKLEGSDWLFGQNDGADEDLIDRVAAREKFLYEIETMEMSQLVHIGESHYYSDRKPSPFLKNDETDDARFRISSVPNCGEGCIWRVDLIISFGVWCIHRILELSRMEGRPELWGKYTYVLNRLQGIIDLAFSKPRTPMTPCFCMHIPAGFQQRSSPPISNGSLPPPVKQGRSKCTTAAMLLDIIKDVEHAISCRKGRSGTAAGDVAYPKGKENVVSVLKRYKRRLSNKPVHEGGPASRKAPPSAPYGS